MRRASFLIALVGCGSPAAVERPPLTPIPAPAAAAPAVAVGPTCELAPSPVPPSAAVWWRPHRTETAESGKTCEVADDMLGRAMTQILALPPPVARAAPARWDRRAAPARLELIARRFDLPREDRQRLAAQGFVVPARLEQSSYAWAYHEIYQSQLPVFISVDSVMHAVYAAHDGLVADLEARELAPRLRALLAAAHCDLPTIAARWPTEIARDVDLYLTVARSLLEDRAVAPALADATVASDAATLVRRAREAGPMQTVALFGRDRVVDWSQYQPRGHYPVRQLAPYFRAVMWLSRVELNLVSRSSRSSAPGDTPDPRETPRETLVALALAELLEASGQGEHLARFEEVFAWLAGRREDVPLPALRALAVRAGATDLRLPDAAARTRQAIGDDYQRTARIHYMPEGSTTLPAIATLLGPRITSDTVAMRQLAHAEVPGRDRIRAGDVAYLLGHDRGKRLLADDLARYPTLGAQLDVARRQLAAAPATTDLYSAWLGAIRATAETPRGVLPGFAHTAAYGDLKLNTAVAAYAGLRHNHVLVAGQPYGEGGCKIPDGYVEPAPAVYDALVRYAELGARTVALLGASADAERQYFERLGRIARVLGTIARLELANQPLPTVAREFLGMVAEMQPFGSDGRPTFTGWYFDLFRDRADAIAAPDFVADYFTSTAGVSYVGTKLPTLGIFVVDTGGGPRAFVGPVAQAYEHHGGSAPRLDDETARAQRDTVGEARWAASYRSAKRPEPTFTIRFDCPESEDWFCLLVEAPAALGPVTIELRDHHRVPLASRTTVVRDGTTRVAWRKAPQAHVDIDAIGVRTRTFFAVRELVCGDGCMPFEFGAHARRPEPDEE